MIICTSTANLIHTYLLIPSFLRSFPHLFCFGTADLTKKLPGQKPTLLSWMRHLTRYIDGRFARDSSFILSGISIYRRHKAITIGNVYATTIAKDLTMEEVKRRIADNDDPLIKSLLHFGATIPGTRQYFKFEGSKGVSFERFVRINSCNKSMLNVFLTFSLPNFWMPELHKHLPGSEGYLGKIVVATEADIPADADPTDYITKKQDWDMRRVALASGGPILDHIANKKLRLVVTEVLENVLGATHWTVRNEFQSRGVLHWHLAVSIPGVSQQDINLANKEHRSDYLIPDKLDPNDPQDRDWLNLMKKLPPITPQEEQDIRRARKHVCDFSSYRLGISTLHPQVDPHHWPAEDGGSCYGPPEENCLIQDFLTLYHGSEIDKEDYERLVNRVEIHRCTSSYCLRVQKLTKAYLCRFKFPKLPFGFKIVTETDKNGVDNQHKLAEILVNEGVTESAYYQMNILELLCTHPRVVSHVPELLCIWRGNCETSLIDSTDAVIKYLLKVSNDFSNLTIYP